MAASFFAGCFAGKDIIQHAKARGRRQPMKA
jgi:hypothetical protein